MSSSEKKYLPSNSGDVRNVVKTATVTSSLLNLSNTIIGAGVLALPSAIAAVGLGLGVFMLALAGCATAFGLYLLAYSASRTPQPASYRSVALATVPKGALFFDFAVGIKCFGVAISYLMIMGDLLPNVVTALAPGKFSGGAASSTSGFSLPALNHMVLVDRRFWITMLLIPLTPLSFQKRLDSLKYTSVVALIAAAYLLWIIVYYSVDGSYAMGEKDKIDMARFSPKFFKSFSIFVFAYTCHQNIFTIHNELADHSLGKMKRIIIGSVGLALVLYQLVGDLGYLMFGRDVKPNVIQMFNENLFVTFGRVAIVLLVMCSYPISIHPSRESFMSMLSGGKTMSSRAFTLITTVLLVATYLLAVLFQRLDTILAFVGATGSTLIGYILPGIFYYKVKQKEYEEKMLTVNRLSDTLPRFWTASVIGAMGMIFFGFVIMILCLGVIFGFW